MLTLASLPKIRRLVVTCLLAAGLGTEVTAAEFSPSKPVTIVVPFAPGGPNDTVARIVGLQLSKVWKQSVLVENRPGAGGVVGVTSVSRAPADGHTLVVATNVLTFPILSKEIGLQPGVDVVPISTIAGGPLLLAAPANGRFHNARDVANFAAINPGNLSVATIALTLANLDAAYLFKHALRSDVLLVPFNSAAQALQALAGEQVDTYFTAVLSAKPLIDAGRVVGLGVAGDKRDPRLPSVPTLKEQGIQFEAGYWIGLYGPKGLSADLASRIAADVAAAVKSEEVQRGIDKAGMSISLAGPTEMRERMRAEEKRYREASKFIKLN